MENKTTTEAKSSTRIERSSKSTFKITKTSVSKSLRMIESSHLGQLNIPFQKALDEAYGLLSIQSSQKEADRLLLQISITGQRPAAYLDYIPSTDQFKTLQGQVLTMGVDFVKLLADMLVDTDFVTKGTPAVEGADDDFNEPEIPFEETSEVGEFTPSDEFDDDFDA